MHCFQPNRVSAMFHWIGFVWRGPCRNRLKFKMVPSAQIEMCIYIWRSAPMSHTLFEHKGLPELPFRALCRSGPRVPCHPDCFSTDWPRHIAQREIKWRGRIEHHRLTGPFCSDCPIDPYVIASALQICAVLLDFILSIEKLGVKRRLSTPINRHHLY